MSEQHTLPPPLKPHSFSDPIADGPSIQAANTVAVSNGITYADCLDFVREARSRGLKTPVMLMGAYAISADSILLYQATTTPSSATVKRRQSRTPKTPVRPGTSWSICLQKRQSSSAISAPARVFPTSRSSHPRLPNHASSSSPASLTRSCM